MPKTKIPNFPPIFLNVACASRSACFASTLIPFKSCSGKTLHTVGLESLMREERDASMLRVETETPVPSDKLVMKQIYHRFISRYRNRFMIILYASILTDIT